MYSAPVWRISTQRKNLDASLLDTGRTPYKRQTLVYGLFPVISWDCFGRRARAPNQIEPPPKGADRPRGASAEGRARVRERAAAVCAEFQGLGRRRCARAQAPPCRLLRGRAARAISERPGERSGSRSRADAPVCARQRAASEEWLSTRSVGASSPAPRGH